MTDQSWRKQLKHRRALVSESEWALLLLASARHVLVEREASVDPKQQLHREVTDGIPGLAEALELRASGLPNRQSLLAWLHTFGHDGSTFRACMDASWAACQLEKIEMGKSSDASSASSTTTTPRRANKVTSRPKPRSSDCIHFGCVFSDEVQDNYAVTLVGNIDPVTQTSQFHTSSWIVNKKWLNFVRSCMVVGRLFEWMDHVVKQTLGNKRTLNQQEAATLMAHQPLLELRNTFNDCCIVLFHALY